MIKKVNCIHNSEDVHCDNKAIKRSLFGIGPRCCVEYGNKRCNLKVKHIKPIPRPAPTLRQNQINIL